MAVDGADNPPIGFSILYYYTYLVYVTFNTGSTAIQYQIWSGGGSSGNGVKLSRRTRSHTGVWGNMVDIQNG